MGGKLLHISRITPTANLCTLSATAPLTGAGAFGVARDYATNKSEYFDLARTSNMISDQVREVSMMVLVTPRAVANASDWVYGSSDRGGFNAMLQLYQESSSRLGVFIRDGAGTGGGFAFTTAGDWANGRPCICIFSNSQHANVTKAWINGKSVYSSTTTTRSAATNLNFTFAGDLYQSSNPGGVQWDGLFSLGATWSRALSQDEAMSLSANPWQIFDYPSRPLFVSSGEAPSNIPNNVYIIRQAVKRAATY